MNYNHIVTFKKIRNIAVGIFIVVLTVGLIAFLNEREIQREEARKECIAKDPCEQWDRQKIEQCQEYFGLGHINLSCT